MGLHLAQAGRVKACLQVYWRATVSRVCRKSFDSIWAGCTAALYARIANTMPLDQPGSLGIPPVTALMAHIFNENGMPAGDKPLEGDVGWLMTVSLRGPHNNIIIQLQIAFNSE